MQRRTPRRRWEHDSRGSNPRDPRVRPAPKDPPADHYNPCWHCAPPHSPWQPSHPSLKRLTQRDSPAGNSRPLRLPALNTGCSSSPYRSSASRHAPRRQRLLIAIFHRKAHACIFPIHPIPASLRSSAPRPPLCRACVPPRERAAQGLTLRRSRAAWQREVRCAIMERTTRHIMRDGARKWNGPRVGFVFFFFLR